MSARRVAPRQNWEAVLGRRVRVSSTAVLGQMVEVVVVDVMPAGVMVMVRLRFPNGSEHWCGSRLYRIEEVLV